MIPVKFINFNSEAPTRGYWDQYFLEKIFKEKNFYIEDHEDDYKFVLANCAVIVLSGSANVKNIVLLNEYISKYDGVVLIITGDEEHNIDVSRINHPNMKLWLMNPDPRRVYTNVDRFIGEGFTPHIDSLPLEAPTKDKKWFFAGQVTHKDREDCIEVLKKLEGGLLIETSGFAQEKISREEYTKAMSESIMIPCPKGPTSPDTFRFYEALEAGCIPILNIEHGEKDYWEMLFPSQNSIPIVDGWNKLDQDKINFFYDTYPQFNNEVFAWWLKYKRDFYWNLIDDFKSIGGVINYEDGITVVIPTSPIKSHPDTSIIEETIRNVRVHLPEAEIIITFDGIRDEQANMAPYYYEYVRKMLWKINKEYNNIFPIVFKLHTHQVGMMREALKHIKTNKVLYVEHDTPLTPDEAINWQECSDMIKNGEADLIRFHYEAEIPEPHKHMMLNKRWVNPNLAFLKTVQWSQRPHLASTEFYKRILYDNFSPDAKTFIEDKMHGVVYEAYRKEQLQGWNKYKLWIYSPDGNIKRSYHLDGRRGEQKYSMKF